MSRIENLKKFLRNSGLLGMQVFNSESLVGDNREIVYSDGNIKVLVCYYWEYVEILGLSESEFNSIKTRMGLHDYIKKTL